jgi:hypothetical protein
MMHCSESQCMPSNLSRFDCVDIPCHEKPWMYSTASLEVGPNGDGRSKGH